MSKAYETVSWDFVYDLLHALVFLTSFIGWVMDCLYRSPYVLLLSGRVQGEFEGMKGL